MDREVQAIPRDEEEAAKADGWVITHRWKWTVLAVRTVDGYELSSCGAMAKWRRVRHGWPVHRWLGQCTYGCAVPVGLERRERNEQA